MKKYKGKLIVILGVAVVALLAALGWYSINGWRLLGNLEYTLIAILIVISVAFALDVFLGEYVPYRYGHDGQLDAGGEE